MKIKQICLDNLGIPNTTDKIPGYRHGDGLHFDANSEIHQMHECIAHIIISAFPQIKTVLDVGSGAGSLSYFLRKLNNDLTVVTIDGNQETINSPFVKPEHHFIVRTDNEYSLVDEKNNLIKFDLICSFEHFEHIEPKAFDQFLSNFKKHSHENTIFWGTAAGYEFHGDDEAHLHCNVQSGEAWAEVLAVNGFARARSSLFEEYYHILSEAWLPPHGRTANSYEFVFKNVKPEIIL